MGQTAVFEQVISEIDKLLAGEKESLIVAIDGMCGSGKSTLGELLQQRYDCNLFHMDDFFLRPEQRKADRLQQPGGNVDYERFKEEVLEHITDKEGLTYGVFDCSRQMIGKCVTAPFQRLNIIEGAYSTHPYFQEVFDLYFFMEINEEEQIRRLAKRNGASKLQRFIEEWIPKEQTYFETFAIKDKCICLKAD